jgi:hypothetical protein
VYARWRTRSPRSLVALGAVSLGIGFGVMALAPGLVVALAGAALAGCGNGIEAVTVRTTLQEHVEPGWMAMMMSLSESLMEVVPGAGILLGGALAALASPRIALAVAAGGSLVVAGLAWVELTPTRMLWPLAGDPKPKTVDGARGDPSGSRSSPAPAGRR